MSNDPTERVPMSWTDLAERGLALLKRIATALEADQSTVRAQVDTELDRLRQAVTEQQRQHAATLQQAMALLGELYLLDPEKYGALPEHIRVHVETEVREAAGKRGCPCDGCDQWENRGWVRPSACQQDATTDPGRCFNLDTWLASTTPCADCGKLPERGGTESDPTYYCTCDGVQPWEWRQQNSGEDGDDKG
ncbi:MAG: hypothetical protein GTN71_05740 [Anaerolineae bacterium]|nr:hypothetical protein [Anaerolineae bacterium]